MAENDDFDENKGDPNVQRNPDDDDVSPAFENGLSMVTDDLVPLSRVILPAGDALLDGATVTLTKVGGSGTVRVLAIHPNPELPLTDDWVEVSLGANLRDNFFLSTGPYKSFNWYAEGLTFGEVTLELKFENGPMRVKDRVVLSVVDLDVVELTFTGATGEYFVVKKDDGSGDYGTPHWKDANRDGDANDTGPPADNRFPAAYLRDKNPQVTAVKIVYEPQGILSGPVRVLGDGPNLLDFQQDLTATGSQMVTSDITAQSKFANEIDFFWPMNIDWRVSKDSGTVWLDAGRTSTQVYVTLGTPNTGSRYHTLLHNSCRDADGKTANADVISAIWGDFTDQAVYRADPKGLTDGTQLTYYDNWTVSYVTTADLLKHGDGQCYAWAQLFINLLGAQGVNQQNDYVNLTAATADGFLVKDWSFPGGNGISGHSTYPFLNLPQSFQTFINQSSYLWRFAEVTDSTGVPGQGTDNPLSCFSNHQLVKIAGQYYDPSYGKVYASLADFDAQAISGYVLGASSWLVNEPDVGLDLNGNGNQTDMGVPTDSFLIQKNPSGNDLSETVTDYP
ncbi:MAG: hypothetical protein IT449_17885 [Phycisphaerales bacterium]|nr:hypothetical protein [Phycisphaerales bacterium]